MITFEFAGKSIDRLKASIVCAAQKDIRERLNGACIDMNNGGCPQLVATDGHRMSVSYVDVINTAPRDTSQYIIPREVLEWVVKLKKPVMVRIEFGDTDVSASSNGQSVKVKKIDDRYPDWRRILSRSIDRQPTESIGLNASYLGDVAKWQKYLGAKVEKGARFEFDGPSSAVKVVADDENYMIIMPTRL